jgi:FkbM family methyltransferase
MKALVLTFDRNAVLTEHMIHRYNQCWPGHPLTFHIPYQSESRKTENWGGGQRVWVPSPADIPGTMAALLKAAASDEWVYWAIDDKYPERLEWRRFEKIVAFLDSPASKAIDGILPCRARRLLQTEFLAGPAEVAPASERLLMRNSWDQIWIHQFLRPSVLQHLFAGMPTEIPIAKTMDSFKFDIPFEHRLAVLEQNAAIFGESLDGGVVLLNTLESLRRAGRPQPLDLPVTRRKAVSMGVLKSTPAEKIHRRIDKYRLKWARFRLGAHRFSSLFTHPAGWEIFIALKLARPDGQFSFFDIGANNGSASIPYSIWFPQATGTLFEAHPDIASKASELIASQQLDHRLSVVPCALSDASGTLTFHVSTARPNLKGFPKISRPESGDEVVMGSSSLLPPADHLEAFPDIHFNATIEVQAERAEDWLNDRNLETPGFLHMDVQGAELKVLEGFGQRLADVAAVWMEVSRVNLYAGAPQVAEVAAWMEAKGFVCAVHAVGKTYGDQLWLRPHLLPHTSKFNRLYEAGVDRRMRQHRAHH